MMKKLIAIILVLCLLGVGAVGYLDGRARAPRSSGAAKTEAVPAPQPQIQTPDGVSAPAQEPETPAQEARTLHAVDLEAVKALHDPAETVMTLDGKPVSWGDYFYLLSYEVRSIDNYFNNLLLYYGMELDWADEAEGDGVSYADVAHEYALDALRQFAAIERFAEDNGVELTEDDLAAIEQKKQENIASMTVDLPEDTDEETRHAAFVEKLAEQNMSEAFYDRVGRVRQLYEACFQQVYGPEGANMDEQAVIAYLTEKGYISVNHILLSTQDLTTGEKLDEAAVAEKKALAESLARELQGISDPVELLKRFNELKTQYCEDTGKLAYPTGYTFTPGTMVEPFEKASQALEEYQVSDPVETDYGYHVILRLPLSGDGLLAPANTVKSARATVAEEEYGQRLQAIQDALQPELAAGFEVPDLLKYLVER